MVGAFAGVRVGNAARKLETYLTGQPFVEVAMRVHDVIVPKKRAQRAVDRGRGPHLRHLWNDLIHPVTRVFVLVTVLEQFAGSGCDPLVQRGVVVVLAIQHEESIAKKPLHVFVGEAPGHVIFCSERVGLEDYCTWCSQPGAVSVARVEAGTCRKAITRGTL